MKTGERLTVSATRHPVLITGLMVLVCAVLGALAALPSIWPETFTALHGVEVDTDPENMLPEDEPVRVFHNDMKEKMGLHDMIVVGVLNEKHPEGVFNPESLGRINELARFAKGLRGEALDLEDPRAGVISIDLISPSNVDHLEPGEGNIVNFDWLMPRVPETQEEALEVRRKAQRIPFLDGTLVSDDGKAICLYLPISSKDLSNRIYVELKEKIAEFEGDDEFHITGLPVAEDVFGVQMFKQMAISAPVAMLIIFILMLIFFRKVSLILSPMIVAMASVICTMSLLIVTGRTVHIMSSMIPIFIMPIAVLDAVHILSDFFDRYQKHGDRAETIRHVMGDLFVPMLYTSMTTAVGFASLALTPIPPVQIFGLFVAFGVMVAWVLTIIFIPAYVMFIPEKWLSNFGARSAGKSDEPRTPLTRFLRATGRITYRHAKLILLIVAVVIVVAVYGISRININDNPIKWFVRSHPIRVADRKLNEHFAGTYMAYLSLEAQQKEQTLAEYAASLSEALQKTQAELSGEVGGAEAAFRSVREELDTLTSQAESKQALINSLTTYADGRSWEVPEEEIPGWEAVIRFLGKQDPSGHVFKQPKVLAYIDRLQQHLLTTGAVGKSNTLSDIVKTTHRELLGGGEEAFRIPETAGGVANCLSQYQNSNRPQDLWHFVTKDFTQSVLWVQLKSGDNRDMSAVKESVDEWIAANPPPTPMNARWFGLTYINVVWQEKMVAGILHAFMGSFLAVFLMMTLLYRSALWGLLCMIPLTVTIALIYGLIGLVGKDYDMPVAVLSSLSLGLAVDYSIHFLTRGRHLYQQIGNWKETAPRVFGEPARAISRNVIVVGVGFLPLLAAPLMPYKTVGMLIAAILLAAGVATLFILPPLMTLLERLLFPRTKRCCLFCNCTTCILSVVAMVVLIAVNVQQFLEPEPEWTTMTWISLGAIILLAALCGISSYREKCRRKEPVLYGEGEGK